MTLDQHLINPNLDVDLASWELTSPSGMEIEWQGEDSEGIETSGSALVVNLTGVGELFGLSQCVAAVGGDAHELIGRVRISSTVTVHPTAGGLVETYASVDCTGMTLSSASTSQIVGDTAGGWSAFSGALQMPAPAQSARVTFFVDAGQSPDFEAAFDRLELRDSAAIFADDFETGDASRWSGSVP